MEATNLTKLTPTASPPPPSTNGIPPQVHGFGNVGMEAESSHGIDFRHLWHVVQERLWLLVACIVAGLVLAVGYFGRTPKLYQGHIVLEVEVAEPSVLSNDDSATRVRSMFLASQEALRTIEQNLTNRSLLARVIRSEGLADDGGRALLGRSVSGSNASPAKDRGKSDNAATTV